MKKGIIFCLAGPSGAGKTTLAESLRKHNPFVKRITTVTTRAPRDGEADGVDYHFWNTDSFQDAIQNQLFFEHELVHGKYYGTLKGSLEDIISQKGIALIILDVNGAVNLKKTFPENCINIFITCSHRHELEKRLTARNTNPDEVKKRLSAADNEQVFFSKNINQFDCLILNDQFEIAFGSFLNVLKQEMVRQGRLLVFED